MPEEDSPADHELDTESWQHVIDDLVAHGVMQIWFTGGEPLLRRDLPVLIRHALARGAERVVVVTNGTIINDTRAQTYADLCRSYPRFAIHLSIDGTTEQSHDDIRGPGAWQRTMRGVSLLRAHGGSVSVVQTTLTRGNVGAVASLPSVVEGLGARGLHMFSLAEIGRARTMIDEHCPPAAWEGAINVLRVMEAAGKKVSLQGPIVGEDWDLDATTVPRAAGSTTPTVVVGPDGDLFPCPFLRHVEIGNATRRDKLDDTVNRFHEVTEAACGTCRYLPMCAGLDLAEPFGTPTGAFSHPHDHFPPAQQMIDVAVALR